VSDPLNKTFNAVLYGPKPDAPLIQVFQLPTGLWASRSVNGAPQPKELEPLLRRLNGQC
jgi:hypothetical protein